MVDFGADKKASQASPDSCEAASDGQKSATAPGTVSAASDGAARADRLAFDEVVGQADLKEALLAVATDDDLDGLLVSGEKGTAKSTLVRGLADLLPEQPVVADCPYGCHPAAPSLQCADCRVRDDPPVAERPVPLVTVPLGATRDRLVGSLSVADALDGEPSFEPGLLARAHRGFLYVDEVNLLDDHLVDVLLDAAASGVNRVERDGVSVAHPADVTLVGTMNPEEGDLRPQLRDRFALRATVAGCEDLDRRVEIVERALGRDSSTPEGTADGTTNGTPEDPAGETTDATDQLGESARRLRRARRLLADVDLPEAFARRIARTCRDAGVDGHRGDVATARAARALAALDGRTAVIEADVRRAAELALPHRLLSTPFEDAPDLSTVLDEAFEEPAEDRPDGDGRQGDEGARRDGEGPRDDEGSRCDGDGARYGSEGDRTDGERRRSAGGDAEAGTDDGSQSDRRSTDDASTIDSTESNAAEGGPGEDGDGGDAGSAPSNGPTDATGTEANGPGARADGRDEPKHGDDPERSNDAERGGEAKCAGDTERGSDRERGSDDGASPDDDAVDDRDATPIVPGQRRGDPASDVDLAPDAAPDAATPDVDVDGDGPAGNRASTSAGPDVDGPRVRTRRADASDRIDAAASVRAAAARNGEAVRSGDLRTSVRRRDGAALVVFAVDASASMRPAMREARATVLELLRDAYQQRDEVAVVAFAGDDANVLLPPTDSVQHAARHLKSVPTGDRTPLPAGLDAAAEVVERADPAASVVVLVTDGRANVADGSPVESTRTAARRLGEATSAVLLVDAGDGGRGSLVDVVADAAAASRLPLGALSAARVDAAVGARADDVR